jgi:hypothetical protein
MITTKLTRCGLLSALLLCSTSCSVTVGATEGTSDSVANTLDASGDFAKASTELTSSTSPRSHAADVGSSTVAEVAKLEAAHHFAQENFSNLRRDIALGKGEYLAAVADIFEIEKADRERYYRLSKASFLELIAENGGTPTSTIELLYLLSKSLDA